MKKKLTLALKIFISLAIAVLLVKYMKLDIKETFITLKNSDWKWFIMCCFALFGTVFTNAYRWRILANQLDYNLSYPLALKMYFEASFGNNFLPSNFGGDAWRSYELGRKDKAWLKAASTVMMERLFGFTMMFALMPIALVALKFSRFHDAIPAKTEMLLWISFGAMIFIYASYFLWSKINIGIIKKIKYALEQYTRCKKSFWTVVLWTFLTHVFLMLSNIFAALASAVSFAEVPFWYWFIVVPTSTLLSFVIPAVKGVGAKEASYIYLLAFIGVSSHDALAIAFLVFLGTLVSTLPGLSVVFRSKTKKQNDNFEASLEDNYQEKDFAIKNK
jgi:uncharacterized protein (TIRG00374 family)